MSARGRGRAPGRGSGQPVPRGTGLALRLVRIGAIAGALPVLFTISQRVGEARGNEPVPGISWALGVVSALFLVRAVVTERTQGPRAAGRKDLLWGVGAGGLLAIATRWWM